MRADLVGPPPRPRSLACLSCLHRHGTARAPARPRRISGIVGFATAVADCLALAVNDGLHMLPSPLPLLRPVAAVVTSLIVWLAAHALPLFVQIGIGTAVYLAALGDALQERLARGA